MLIVNMVLFVRMFRMGTYIGFHWDPTIGIVLLMPRYPAPGLCCISSMLVILPLVLCLSDVPVH